MNETENSNIYGDLPLTRPPLRIGIMLDDSEVPAWMYKIIADISASQIAGAALLIFKQPGEQKALSGSRLQRLLKGETNLRGALYARYLQWDERRNVYPHSPFDPVNIDQILPDCARIQVRPQQGRFVDKFAAEDIQRIKRFDLDVILRFGFRIIKGEVLNSARHGVWSYHHGDNHHYRGGPALFWEMYEKNPVSGTVLQQLTEELDGGQVIYRSYSATEGRHWLSQNRLATYWKTSTFVMRCLRTLYRQGAEGLQPEPPQSYQKPIYREPDNLQMLGFISRFPLNMLKYGIKDRLYKDLWFIAYRQAAPLNSGVPHTAGFKTIMPPHNRFYADPFAVRHDNRDYIFFEDYDYDSSKGIISYLEVSQEGMPGPVKPALICDYHLSYPFMFEWNGQMYMLPETMDNQTVELYVADAFPDKWRFVTNLLSGIKAVDATLFVHDGTWYLFVNINEAGGSACDELFLFSASSPLGPFEPHPHNPIVSDARRARPAGAIFIADGRIIRPSQDCTGGYGRALNFNEITRLDAGTYEERLIGKIEPDWLKGLNATHTYNRSATLEVIDGKKPVRR